ncbi:MAG: hypothetical protein AAF539_03155 [Planctomycetota bacterium]
MLVVLTSVSLRAGPPLCVSGIYPEFTAFNSNARRSSSECGIGGVVPWAGKLWYLSYTSHALKGSNDKLHVIDANYNHEEHPASVGGTHACRMIHAESNQLILGCYFIDAKGSVRVVSRNALPGRLTAVSRHLHEPHRKVPYLTQEGAVYEVDVQTLEATLLFTKPAAGWHAKGAYTGQGVFVISNNGEQPAPSVFWKIDYSKDLHRAQRHASQFFKTANPEGHTLLGSLSEWDGDTWKLIARDQFLDVTGPGGLSGARKKNDPLWALGWDEKSAIIESRQNGHWSRYRFPKPSYSIDMRTGGYTEWPRIREFEPGRYMAFINNALFDFPARFGDGNTAGFRPINSMLRIVTDFCTWDDRLVLASQDASLHGVTVAPPGQVQSNLHFTSYESLSDKGPPIGWGSLWRNDFVHADAISDPMAIAGYQFRTLHLFQQGVSEAQFHVEIDPDGNGQWEVFDSVTLAGGECESIQLPDSLNAHWLRLRSDQATKATATLHAFSNRVAVANEEDHFLGVTPISGADSETQSLLTPGHPTRDLRFWIKDRSGRERFYEIDERLSFKLQTNRGVIDQHKKRQALTEDFYVDAASVVVKRADGRRYRLPKGDAAFDQHNNLRAIREVVQERFLGNLHGTFYEIPRVAEGRIKEFAYAPDYRRIKPVASHHFAVEDFTVWRGLLVMSGIASGPDNSNHTFRSQDNFDCLWFGEIDDLWKLGKPKGRGGPWMESDVWPGAPSDPYLMTGFDQKSLELSHQSDDTVQFILEHDFLADDSWHFLKRFSVGPGETVRFDFPTGFSTH